MKINDIEKKMQNVAFVLLSLLLLQSVILICIAKGTATLSTAIILMLTVIPELAFMIIAVILAVFQFINYFRKLISF